MRATTRGSFSLPRPATRIEPGTVLLLAGTRASLAKLEQMAGDPARDDLVIVIGYGTVGRAAAAYLERDHVPHVLADRDFGRNDAVHPSGAAEGDAGWAGATVIAVQQGDADPDLDVGPATILPRGGSLLMVGTPASETAFSERFQG